MLGLFVVYFGHRFWAAATFGEVKEQKPKKKKSFNLFIAKQPGNVFHFALSGKGLMKKFCKLRFTLEGVI